jgi:hypothetical protein
MRHLSDDDLVAQAKLGNDQAFTDFGAVMAKERVT